MADERETKALAEGGGVDLARAPLTYKTLQAIANTQFIPKELRGKVPAILACIMAGRELGLGPMESLQKINVVDGRPGPSAELLVAMVFRAGHKIYPKDLSTTSATAVGVRLDSAGNEFTTEYTFTMDDAERAGLAGKHNFKTYPGPMLYWRAASQLVRIFFPDVVTAMKAYTEDELGSEEWVPPDPVSLDALEPPVESGVDPGDDEPVEAEIVEEEPCLHLVWINGKCSGCGRVLNDRPRDEDGNPIRDADGPADEPNTHGQIIDPEDPGRPFSESETSTETEPGPEPPADPVQAVRDAFEDGTPEAAVANGIVDSAEALTSDPMAQALAAVTDLFPEAEVMTPEEQAADAEQMWGELYALCNDEAWLKGGTVGILKANTKRIFWLAVALGVWPEDAYRQGVETFAKNDPHVSGDTERIEHPVSGMSGLKIKPYMIRFAARVVSWMRTELAKKNEED